MSKKDLSYLRMDSTDDNFPKNFNKYKNAIFKIISNSYEIYYGNEYHKKRIIEGKALVYLCFFKNALIGVSYVKKNGRRGMVAVLEDYRKKGIAKALVKLSLKDFPFQYTVVSADLEHSYKIISLFDRLNFQKANSERKIKEVAINEYFLFSNFRHYKKFFVFDRTSKSRNSKRKCVTLLYRK